MSGLWKKKKRHNIKTPKFTLGLKLLDTAVYDGKRVNTSALKHKKNRTFQADHKVLTLTQADWCQAGSANNGIMLSQLDLYTILLPRNVELSSC